MPNEEKKKGLVEDTSNADDQSKQKTLQKNKSSSPPGSGTYKDKNKDKKLRPVFSEPTLSLKNFLFGSPQSPEQGDKKEKSKVLTEDEQKKLAERKKLIEEECEKLKKEKNYSDFQIFVFKISQAVPEEKAALLKQAKSALKKVNFDAVDHKGRNPLHTVIVSRVWELLIPLVEKLQEKPKKQIAKILQQQAVDNDISRGVLEYILSVNLKEADTEQIQLILNVSKSLMQLGAKIDFQDQPGIRIKILNNAVINGHIETVKLILQSLKEMLIDLYKEINVDQLSSDFVAVYEDTYYGFLIKGQTTTQEKQYSPLHLIVYRLAAEQQKDKILMLLKLAKRLIEKGASLAAIDYKKRNPLHTAISAGAWKLLSVFLHALEKNPSEVNVVLQQQAQSESLPRNVLEYLLGCNLKNEEGKIEELRHKYVLKIANQLIKLGAKIDFADNTLGKIRVLNTAAENGQIEIIKLIFQSQKEDLIDFYRTLNSRLSTGVLQIYMATLFLSASKKENKEEQQIAEKYISEILLQRDYKSNTILECLFTIILSNSIDDKNTLLEFASLLIKLGEKINFKADIDQKINLLSQIWEAGYKKIIKLIFLLQRKDSELIILCQKFKEANQELGNLFEEEVLGNNPVLYCLTKVDAVEEFKKLVDQDKSVLKRLHKGTTLLHVAAVNEGLEILAWAANNINNPEISSILNYLDPNNKTVLELLLSYKSMRLPRQIEVALKLIGKGAIITFYENKNFKLTTASFLLSAIENGMGEVVNKILQDAFRVFYDFDYKIVDFSEKQTETTNYPLSLDDIEREIKPEFKKIVQFTDKRFLEVSRQVTGKRFEKISQSSTLNKVTFLHFILFKTIDYLIKEQMQTDTKEETKENAKRELEIGHQFYLLFRYVYEQRLQANLALIDGDGKSLTDYANVYGLNKFNTTAFFLRSFLTQDQQLENRYNYNTSHNFHIILNNYKNISAIPDEPTQHEDGTMILSKMTIENLQNKVASKKQEFKWNEYADLYRLYFHYLEQTKKEMAENTFSGEAIINIFFDKKENVFKDVEISTLKNPELIIYNVQPGKVHVNCVTFLHLIIYKVILQKNTQQESKDKVVNYFAMLNFIKQHNLAIDFAVPDSFGCTPLDYLQYLDGTSDFYKEINQILIRSTDRFRELQDQHEKATKDLATSTAHMLETLGFDVDSEKIDCKQEEQEEKSVKKDSKQEESSDEKFFQQINEDVDEINKSLSEMSIEEMELSTVQTSNTSP